MKEEVRTSNCFVDECPELLAEWDYEKNSGIDNLRKITTHSNKKVWWKCDKGHEWEARIADRVVRKNTCPYCSGQRVLPGINDLGTLYPHLAEEWNHEKNQGISLETMFPKSGKRVWWKCEKNHEWQARVIDRANGKRACPYCTGLKPTPGMNDLKTLHPDLMDEWNFERNTDIHPEMLFPKSGKKVWWKCKQGHEWEAYVSNRVSKNYKCPYCTGVKVLVGFNDLKTLRPDIIREWNYDRNKEILPEAVTVKSGKKVWWKCEKGHEWQTTVAQRSYGSGCPICKNRKSTTCR